ncbi:probable RNA-dependent RNA polymerase 1, partial [Tanacetum coccineum]
MVKTVDVSGFPGLESADKIKTVLERYTGNGSIEALEVKQTNGGTRAYARVQFTTREKVDYIIDLASRSRLRYGRSYLKVWQKDMDLVQKPRHYALELNGVTLHFGCQVSKQVLSVLYTMKNASVKFGFGARKLYFGFTEPRASYKLQLSYENIWQVQFHRPRGYTSSFLVIQGDDVVKVACCGDGSGGVGWSWRPTAVVAGNPPERRWKTREDEGGGEVRLG